MTVTARSPQRVAVLFDLGNVLVRVRSGHAVDSLVRVARSAETTVPNPEMIVTAYLDRLGQAFNAGKRSPNEFFAGLGAELGCALPREQTEAAWCDIFDPWPEMETLAEAVVSAGHPTYLLSNTDPVHYAWLTERIPVLQQMTGHHLSCEVGLIKPDPAYFTDAMQRLSLSPERCIFIDDRSENVNAARTLGLAAHQHTGDIPAVRTALRTAGVNLR